MIDYVKQYKIISDSDVCCCRCVVNFTFPDFTNVSMRILDANVDLKSGFFKSCFKQSAKGEMTAQTNGMGKPRANAVARCLYEKKTLCFSNIRNVE